MQHDMKFRLWQPCKCIMFVFGVLSLAPCYSGKFERQVRRADQALYPIQSGSFVGRGPWLYATSPCKRKSIRNEEVLHLYRCYTHTHTACSGVWFWKIVAVEVGRTNQIKWTYTMLVYKAAVISLRREIRFELKYLDRFAEAHAFNSSPCVVDFSRCHSCRQSVWKLFG